jgi:hypothetical protein
MTVNTTTPYSETSIANQAIDILDDNPLTSLDQGGVVAGFMHRNFGPVRDWLQEVYPFHFTKKRANLAEDTDTPAFGWKYQYTLPADCLRVLPLRKNGDWNGDLIPHEVEDGKILCDVAGPLPVRYVARKTNPAKFPPIFARLLACRLALLGSMNITGKGTYFDKANTLYQEALEHARLSDTLESGTPEDQYDDSIIKVRGVGIVDAA